MTRKASEETKVAANPGFQGTNLSIRRALGTEQASPLSMMKTSSYEAHYKTGSSQFRALVRILVLRDTASRSVFNPSELQRMSIPRRLSTKP